MLFAITLLGQSLIRGPRALCNSFDGPTPSSSFCLAPGAYPTRILPHPVQQSLIQFQTSVTSILASELVPAANRATLPLYAL
ncbi:hypothetical protein EV356DRAFT_508825 [Viridothelium virens]|uniref:Uncharacterized protein n=1 Tax=Viridothelium virens TaxID=1048519 RepID=A0A6A6HJL8_VIRVR|nr:hypothetical protein EV356DRAFT_508825 [Viridothelium virens]